MVPVVPALVSVVQGSVVRLALPLPLSFYLLHLFR
jgi:hypothetical protein